MCTPHFWQWNYCNPQREEKKKIKGKKKWEPQHQSEFSFQPLNVEIPLDFWGEAYKNTSEHRLAHLVIMFKVKDIPDFLDCLK